MGGRFSRSGIIDVVSVGSSVLVRVETGKARLLIRHALGGYALELPASVFDLKQDRALYVLAGLPGRHTRDAARGRRRVDQDRAILVGSFGSRDDAKHLRSRDTGLATPRC